MTWHLRLSWPAQTLWQNRKAHWAKQAKSVAAARTEAWAEARAAALPRNPNAVIEFQFHPPDNRRRDCSNLPATMKAAIDGIADAMGCDDTGFRCVFPTTFGPVVKRGCVCVTIRDAEWVMSQLEIGGDDNHAERLPTRGGSDGIFIACSCK